MPLVSKCVVLDFETASYINLKRSGAWRYAEDLSTEILWLSWEVFVNGASQGVRCWTPQLDVGSTDELRALAEEEGVTFIAFNVAFEKAIWRKIMMLEFGLPDVPNFRWHDIQAVCAMKGLPLEMGKAADVLNMKHQKDTAGSKFTIALSKPHKKTGQLDRSQESILRVGAYCDDDIHAESEMHWFLGWLPPGARGSWLINQTVNERGIKLDMDYVSKCQEIVRKASGPLNLEFAKITGGLMPTQRDKVMKWIDARGVNLPDMRKETLDAILGEQEEPDYETDAEDFMSDEDAPGPLELPDDVHRALSIRRIVGSSSISKLDRMVECVCEDGRARGLLQWNGTGPGRNSGRLLQPHNFPRPTLKMEGKGLDPMHVVEAIMTGDPDYVELICGPAIETVINGLRHALVADKGRKFISGDYAGIQLRVLLALAGQHDKCELLAAGKNAYVDMAQQIYKRPVDKHNDIKEYTVGKNAVLGLGFQMGAKKFYLKYNSDGTLEFCEEVVDTYRYEWAPKVPPLWYALQDAATRCVWDRKPTEAYGLIYRMEDGWLSAQLPSGRKIWYAQPIPVKRPVPWDKDDIREGFTYRAMKMGQWRTIHAFGGQLTENYVMAVEVDIMRHAQRLCFDEGIPMVLEVHDEIVVEPEVNRFDEKAMTQVMTDVQPWVKALKVPIAVECWTGDRYRK